MSVFQLKIVAMAAMTLDHFAHVMMPAGLIGGGLYTFCRAVGRIAFPLFAFLISNGLEHSSNKLRYFTRLLSFALISQPAFSLAWSIGSGAPCALGELTVQLALPGSFSFVLLAAAAAGALLLYRNLRAVPAIAALLLPFCTLSLGSLSLLGNMSNVFYTLGLGMSLLWLMDEAERCISRRNKTRLGLLAISWLAAAALLAPRIDYGWLGLALIAGLGLCRRQGIVRYALLGLWCALQYLPGTELYFATALAALPFIALYNGEKGKAVKLGFYAFYPLHLFVLSLLSLAMSI